MWKVLHAIIWLVALASPLAEVGARRHHRQVDRIPPELYLDRYLTYEGMMEYLDRLAVVYSDRLQLQDVGRTHEGRFLRIAKVSSGIEASNKRVIFMDANFHAREWTTPITALYVIHQLVVESGQYAHLLANTDWVILPMANPDGYEYSQNVYAMWRNTRTPNENACYGTNLNRNFGVGWGEGFPELKDPCNDNYAGTETFSEVEARAVRDIMHSLVEKNVALMYLSLHTANRSIFYPWFNEPSANHNKQEQEEIAQYAARKIRVATGTVIKPRPGYKYGERIGGTSVDYAFKVGFPLAFIFEMSGTGSDGVEYKFFPQPQFIRYLVVESWVGIRALAEKAIEKYPSSRPLNNPQRHDYPKNAAPSNRNYFNVIMKRIISLMGYIISKFL